MRLYERLRGRTKSSEHPSKSKSAQRSSNPRLYDPHVAVVCSRLHNLRRGCALPEPEEAAGRWEGPEVAVAPGEGMRNMTELRVSRTEMSCPLIWSP